MEQYWMVLTFEVRETLSQGFVGRWQRSNKLLQEWFHDLLTFYKPSGYVSFLFILIFWRHWGLSLMPAAAAAKSLQSCPTLCDPIDSSPPGSAVPGILHARTLEWVAISFSNAWKWKVKVKSLSHVRLLATTWTAAYQAPPSMGCYRQEYWSGLHLAPLP